MPSYRETVPIAPWVVLLLVSLFAVSVVALTSLRGAVAADAPRLVWVWDISWAATLLGTVGVPLFLGRLVILVEEGTLVLRFGFVPMIVKEIPLALISHAEAVTYRPIRQFGGWGIRRGTFAGERTAVYSMRGSDGVLLSLNQPIDTPFLRTRRVLIGSESPRSLVDQLAA